jgi:hypothetical protein
MSCSIVVTIDRSVSMEGTYLNTAKSDATMFINVMNTGDNVAVVAFDTTAEVIFPKGSTALVKITSKEVQKQAQQAIMALKTQGVTNITAALQIAAAMLTPKPLGPVGEVFLSDGDFNEGENPLLWLKKEPNPRAIPIHTIALGGGGHEATLYEMATMTGGQYHYVRVAEDLGKIYDLIANEAGVARLIAACPLTLPQNDSEGTKFTFPAGAAQATIAVNWSDWDVVLVPFDRPAPAVPFGNEVKITLKGPDGRIAMPPTGSGNGFAVFKIPNPVAGDYTVSVWYTGTATLSYTVAMFDNSSITAAIAGPQRPVPAGSPATVELRLADGGEPIDGARLNVTLDSPLVTLQEAAAAHADRLKEVSVPDDIPEAHQVAAKIAALRRQTGEELMPREVWPVTAEAMGGGLYRVQIPSLGKAGSHTVDIVAHGYSGKSKTPFQRHTRLSFIASAS